MEHSCKFINICKSNILSNCFINKIMFNCNYNDSLNTEIEYYRPTSLNTIRVPEFYKNIIKLKLCKLT